MAGRRRSLPTLSSAPIFILGLTPRSGTNYFQNLLRLHPGCRAGGVVHEDFLVHYADLLVAYTDELYDRWNPRWRVEERLGPPERLHALLGEALLGFLNLQVGREPSAPAPASQPPRASPPAPDPPPRLVTKTPSLRNLERFFDFFPSAQLLLVVRDGRAVVESGVRSLHWSYEEAMRRWAAAARAVLRFDRDARAAGHAYVIVRFEDLYHETERELRRIFTFLGLDPAAYDFERARSLPLSGSSESPRDAAGRLQWKWIAPHADFDPTRRWERWGRALHERFNWLAGEELVALGYDPRTFSGDRRQWEAWNRARDLRWGLRERLRRFRKRRGRKPVVGPGPLAGGLG